MKILIILLFFSQMIFSQSRIIYLQDISLQLGRDSVDFFEELNENGFEINNNGNGNFFINKEIDGIRYQANVRFINNKIVSASKIWGVYPIDKSFNALKDYFNLLENQEYNDQLNVFFTQRFTDINTENFTIINSFGEYRIEINFDTKMIVVTEDLYKVEQ